jgi:hypothetical protein
MFSVGERSSAPVSGEVFRICEKGISAMAKKSTTSATPKAAPKAAAPKAAAPVKSEGVKPVKKVAAPTSEQIAARAFAIWERKGKPAGQDAQNWAQAEAELRAGK